MPWLPLCRWVCTCVYKTMQVDLGTTLSGGGAQCTYLLFSFSGWEYPCVLATEQRWLKGHEHSRTESCLYPKVIDGMKNADTGSDHARLAGDLVLFWFSHPGNRKGLAPSAVAS